MPQQRVPDKETARQVLRIVTGTVKEIEDQMNDFLNTMEDNHIFEVGTQVHGGASDLVIIINYRVAVEYLVIEYGIGKDGEHVGHRVIGKETPGGLITPEIKLKLK